MDPLKMAGLAFSELRFHLLNPWKTVIDGDGAICVPEEQHDDEGDFAVNFEKVFHARFGELVDRSPA